MIGKERINQAKHCSECGGAGHDCRTCPKIESERAASSHLIGLQSSVVQARKVLESVGLTKNRMLAMRLESEGQKP